MQDSPSFHSILNWEDAMEVVNLLTMEFEAAQNTHESI